MHKTGDIKRQHAPSEWAGADTKGHVRSANPAARIPLLWPPFHDAHGSADFAVFLLLSHPAEVGEIAHASAAKSAGGGAYLRAKFRFRRFLIGN